MDALSEDLRALVVAKELTLKQAIELNKQKAPVEEGLDKIVNLFDDDVEFERFTQSVQSDVVALRGGVQWENGQSALVSPGPKRRPGNKIKVFCCRKDNGDLWQLLRTQCNTQTKVKGNPTKADDIPIHPLQQGIHGVSMQHFLKLLDSDVSATDIVEVKVFACSLESHTIFHFSTASRVFIESFNNDDAVHGSNGIFKAEYAAAPFRVLLASKNYKPLRGHTATRKRMADFDMNSFSASLFSIFQLWIRFENQIVSTKLFDGRSGPIVKEAPPLVETRAPKGSLKVLHQPSLDETVIGNMVMADDYGIEMQRLMISEIPEGSSGIIEACFLCQGTGRRRAAEEYVYGKEAMQHEDQRMREVESALEKKQPELSISSIALETSDSNHVGNRSTSVFSANGRKVMPSPVDLLKKQISYDLPKYDQCFLCMGTGKVSKMKEALIVESNPESEEDCLICWSAPQKYGISTECTHFFCEVCIKMHLQQVMNSGKFPGYCPLCEASAPKGEAPRYGKISGKALSFLERRGIIDKEFQFMFMRKQEELQELFFACPAKCGNYLVDIDPTYVLRKNKVVARVERCPCGQGVCVQCHALVKDKDFEKHTCPDQNKAQQDDLATIALMKKLGKKCPHCNMFIMKNAGCDGKCTQMRLSMILSNKA